MPTDYNLGYQGKVYRKVTTTWTEDSNVIDVQIPFAPDKIDMSSRAGGKYKQYAPGQADLSTTVSKLWSEADTHMMAYRAAAIAGTVLDMAFLSEDKANADACGWYGKWHVFGFNQNQALNEGQKVDVTFAPAPDAVPTHIIGGGSLVDGA